MAFRLPPEYNELLENLKIRYRTSCEVNSKESGRHRTACIISDAVTKMEILKHEVDGTGVEIEKTVVMEAIDLAKTAERPMTPAELAREYNKLKEKVKVLEAGKEFEKYDANPDSGQSTAAVPRGPGRPKKKKIGINVIEGGDNARDIDKSMATKERLERGITKRADALLAQMQSLGIEQPTGHRLSKRWCEDAEKKIEAYNDELKESYEAQEELDLAEQLK